MGRYVVRRFGFMLLSLWVIVRVSFILMNAVPGGPFTSVKLTPLVEKQLERKYGARQTQMATVYDFAQKPTPLRPGSFYP